MKWLVNIAVSLLCLWGFAAYAAAAATERGDVISQMIEHAHQMEARYEIPIGLLAEACHTESRWKNVSGDQGRSIGVCQVQPATVIEVNRGKNPYETTSTAFALGAKGPTVAAIQAALVREGVNDNLVVDSIFGSRTDDAVRIFQRQRGLRVDGIVGPVTWSKLMGTPYPGRSITKALWDEQENIEWAARILRHRFEQCGHGSWALAIAAYNGGCGNSVVVHTGRVLDNWKGKIVYLPADPRQELF